MQKSFKDIPKETRREVMKNMLGFADEATEAEMFPEERGGGTSILPPTEDQGLPKAVEEVKSEEVKKDEEKEIEIGEAIEKLKKISEAEGVAKEIKKSAEEFMTQLEELKKLKENLDKFIADNYKEMASAEAGEGEKMPAAIA